MLWDAIRESLHESLPESEFCLWIKPLVCRRFDDQVIELAGPDRFFCSWIKDRYLNLISEKIRELHQGPNRTISLIVGGQPSMPVENNNAGQLCLPGVHNNKSQIRSLHPGYTFEQFMVGQSNVLARSACHALARGEKTFGNFIFINSSTGLGKSHLTQAVVHSILRQAPSTMLHYLTAQQFSSEMVNGIRNKSMDQFSRKFVQYCDVLLVEDVHTLIGKNKTQDELNTVLDYLIKSGKRVVLTSSVAPGKLDGIDEDFKSRMSSGLVTRIDAPDYGTRVNIIRHKARANDLALDESLVDLLAQYLCGDIRKTESAIIGIKAKSSLLDTPPDKTVVMEVLRDMIGTRTKLDGETIRSFIGNQFKITVDQLKSKSRKRSISFPRQVGMYITRKYTDQSLADIGDLYKRDHSTVLHAIKVVTREMSKESSVNEQIELLCRKVQKL
ncbi:MAG: chromosomal replication initiator protein DnaA [Desulfobulbaceae bacterium]|nr:chromosomal replication initiator protein DnaA [Desulfobulbaceae bacterium]